MHRVPIKFESLANSHRDKLWRARIKQNIRSRRLQLVATRLVLPSPVELKDGAALAWRAVLMLPSLSTPPRPAL